MIRDCHSFRTIAGSKYQTYGHAVSKASTGKPIVTHNASLLLNMELPYNICFRNQDSVLVHQVLSLLTEVHLCPQDSLTNSVRLAPCFVLYEP
jgi:hypothetical protein